MNRLLFAVGVAGGVMAIAALAVMAGIWPLDVRYASYVFAAYVLGGGLNYFALLRSCATSDA